MRLGAEVYHTLKGVIKDKYGKDATNVGDEGGFAPNILENSEALELVKEAIDKAGYTEKIVIGMDVAASEFHRDGKYDLDFKSPADPSRYITGDSWGHSTRTLSGTILWSPLRTRLTRMTGLPGPSSQPM